MAVNPKICPICHNNNHCGNEAGLQTCWCRNFSFPDGIFKLVTEHKACICRECLMKYNKLEDLKRGD
jgi:hypothetical protein